MPATSSTSRTVPTAFPVRGSSTRRPTLAAWSWGGKRNRWRRAPDRLAWPRSASSSTMPDRLALVDEVVVGHAAQLVVAPPERLVLAAVPAEQLGQEPGRPLLVGHRPAAGRVDPSRSRGQGVRPRSATAAGALLRLGGSIASGCERAAGGSRIPSRSPRSQPPVLEPVAQAPGAHDVVAVVALDPAQDRVADEPLGGGAAAEPGLELDDAAPRVLQGRPRASRP